MSRLTVSTINTENSTTPLVITTGNSSSGFIKVESGNTDIVFSGNSRFLGGLEGAAPTAAFTTANLASTTANAAFAKANSVETIAIAAFNDSNTALANSTGTFAGDLTVTGFVRDSKGDIRDVPVSTQSTPYAISLNDTGEVVSTTANVFIPAAVFSAGQTVTVYNNSAASIFLISNTSVTMYLAGTATTGNRTLAQRGLATVLCVAANTFVATGAGLT